MRGPVGLTGYRATPIMQRSFENLRERVTACRLRFNSHRTSKRSENTASANA